MTAVRQRSTMREPALWQAVGNTPLLPVELPDGAAAGSGSRRSG